MPFKMPNIYVCIQQILALELHWIKNGVNT
jgi:hypothetical protein